MQLGLETHATLVEARQFLEQTPREAASAPFSPGAYAHLGFTLGRSAY